MVNAAAATRLTRRRRRATGGGAGRSFGAPPAGARTAITARLRAALDFHGASLPSGSRQVRRLVKGPPPSARRSCSSSRAAIRPPRDLTPAVVGERGAAEVLRRPGVLHGADRRRHQRDEPASVALG